MTGDRTPPREARGRRGGGREARLAQRAAPLPDFLRPARPGVAGGRYKPLGDADVKRLHRAALQVLARTGIGDAPTAVIERALEAGCRLTDTGRLLFPESLVEDVIAGAARNFVLHGRDPRHDIEVKGRKVHYGTGGAAVLDLESGRYRPSTLADLYDFARLADRMDYVSWFTRICVATDIADPLDLDINTCYAIAAGTTKHIGTSFVTGAHITPAVEMFDAILGSDGAFRRRPFCKVHISPIVSPLRYGHDAVDVALAAIAHGMPINAIIAAQSGATAPAPLAGMLVHSLAETLAALVMVNLFAPGHPVIFSNWPFVIDLRTGSFSGSGGEITLLNAASAQLSNFYDLPSGVAASMADAKTPDAQAGYEKAMSLLAAGLAGANLVYESAGMFASLMGASFEGFVIDNEMIGNALRVVRGIEVSDDTVGLDVIDAVCNGPGHFLGHDQTVAAMQRDYLYPDLGDRLSSDAWEEGGAMDMRTRARERARDILASHYPQYIEPETDARIRARFNILLPPERMRPRRDSRNGIPGA